jgi:glycosyltransferase involved in cell wall biosynthesis
VLTGLVPSAKIPELCNAMDILVHPSRREGLARALAQGALAGVPVIAYDVDGNREGVLDNLSGFVLKPFERDKLSEALALLLADEPRRCRMGEAGRAFALARFDARAMVEALESVYQSAVQTPITTG